MHRDTKMGELLLRAALVGLLWTVAGGGVQGADARGMIDITDMPSGQVFFPGDAITFSLIVTFDRAVSLENPTFEYKVFTLDGDTLLTKGTVPFELHSSGRGGRADLAPQFQPLDGNHWYRLELALASSGGDPVALSYPAADAGEPSVSFGVVSPEAAGAEALAPQASAVNPKRKVMAFYYTWYANPAVSRRWLHWPEGGHVPSRLDADGLPDVGAARHPVLGPYDSYDTRVIRQHLAWSEAAGIDVLIATWWGQRDFTDLILPTLLDAAEASAVKISLYYEAIPGGRPEAVIDDLRYLVTRYGDHPALFKHEDAPVVFVYGRALHQISTFQWRQVLETVKADHDIKVIADSPDAQYAEIFDGLHMYNPVGQVVGGSDMPRLFESLVWAAESQGKISSVTIIPGYDDSNIGRSVPTIAPRRDGGLYDELWAAAIQSRPEWIIITSFNEWHEGSEIEPSMELGATYLKQTAEWSRRFREASRRTLRVVDSSMPVLTVPDVAYPIEAELALLEAGGPVSVWWDLPQGWWVEGKVPQRDGDEHMTVTGELVVPAGAAPGRYPIGVRFSLDGYSTRIEGEVVVPDTSTDIPFEGDGVLAVLGETNQDFGLIQRDQPDGATAPVVVGGVSARKTVQGVSGSRYMYFDVADRYLSEISDTPVEIGIEYLDEGFGTFRVQYDSHNPLGDINGAYMGGATIALRNSGEWRTARFQLLDARFANRQNGGSDFRIAVGSGELTVRSAYVRTLD